MRGPVLGLCALVLAGSGGARAQTSAAPAQAVPGTAQAADPGKPAPQLLDAAKRHYDDAVRFYQEGRYDAARIEFEASFALSKEPDLLYNLSTTAEKQGQLADAIRYAERYLEVKPDAEDIAKVKERIARLRAQQSGPSSPPIPAPPAAVQPPSEPTVLLVAPPPSTSSSVRPPLVRAPLVLLGVGGVLLLGGVGAGAGAFATAREIENRGMIPYRELTDLEGRGKALNIAAISLSTVGGAMVVAGGSWLAVVKSRQREQR